MPSVDEMFPKAADRMDEKAVHLLQENDRMDGKAVHSLQENGPAAQAHSPRVDEDERPDYGEAVIARA